MSINKYIGSRYVPLYIGVHDENKSYEPLSIVSNEAKTKTYTSKKPVPIGVSIDNEDYWAQSGYFQDGIVDIHPDIYEVASYDQPTFTVTKGEEEAELKLEVADSYSAGDSFGEAYVLNTLTQAGLYIIKPSACVEVPEAIAEVETPVSLSVILYNVDSNPCYMQQIVSDNAIYVRHCDSKTVWGDWQEISGGGGGYTLPVASATKLGGVKIGSGISIDDTGIISMSVSPSGDVGTWVDITNDITVKTGTLLGAYKNDSLKECLISFTCEPASNLTAGYNSVKLVDMEGFPIPYDGRLSTSENKLLFYMTSNNLSFGELIVGSDGGLDLNSIYTISGNYASFQNSHIWYKYK